MIGLSRHIVRLSDHHPDWPGLAAAACRQVIEACGDLIVDVQHVGSTAVPDLPAKPILDLAVAADSELTLPEIMEKLIGLGYTYRGDGKDSGGHLFVWNAAPDFRTIHLHVVTQDDVQWTNYLKFRDELRRDAGLRHRYAELKRSLEQQFRHDRESYTSSKHDFIAGVLQNRERGI